MRSAGGGFDLNRLGGLARAKPALAALFLVSALSLAGLPPFSGFWAKLAVLEATLAAGRPVLAIIAVAAGLLTLLSMLKIWNLAFWRPAPGEGQIQRAGSWATLAPVVVLVACTVAMGLHPEPFLAAFEEAATQLLDAPAYIQAVLGESAERVAWEAVP
jgi:multicomponent Na+:H+ antiporter subunit D